jgi:sugar/nucleoside kinase (ribokinase family)
MLKGIEFAKKHNTKVSMDLSDPALIERNREKITELVKDHIDIVFANEQEARTFTKENPRDSLDILANYCEIAIVKLGENGSLIKSNPEFIEISADKTKPIDTTGAGDMYAAGFLYGITNDKSLEESGKIASKHATKVVKQMGARLD